MANAGMNVLPQFQGDYYQLQQQQALAQALMSQSLQSRAPTQTVGSGGSQNYQVMPKMSIGSGLAQIGQALVGAKLQQSAAQGLTALGQKQVQTLTGDGQPADDGSSGYTSGQAGTLLGANSPTPQALAAAIGNWQPSSSDGQSPQTDNSSPQVSNAAPINGGTVNSQPSGGSGSSSAGRGMLFPGGPMNPAGWPVQMAAMRYLNDQDGYWKDQAAALAPTDTIKNNNWMGVTRQQAASNYQNTATKDSALIGHWGYATPNGQGGFNPTIVPTQIPGAQLTTQNGGQSWAYNPIQGGPQALQQESGAKAAGNAQFNIRPGVDPATGKPVYTTDYNLANGLPPPGAAGGSASGGSPSGRFGSYQAPNSAATAPSLPPGGNELASGSAQTFNSLRTQAGSTPVAIDGYNKAEDALLQGVPTGPGSSLGANIIGRLNTAGIPLMKGDATGYQSLQKYLSNANAQAASAGGYSGSDARFDAFSHGQPSAENMNPESLRYAIQYVRGQQAGVQAKYQAAQSFLNAQGGSTVNYPQFEAQWNRAYSPDVMMVKSMPNPADQQAYLANLKKQGKLNTWIKSYQSMQQMGAF